MSNFFQSLSRLLRPENYDDEAESFKTNESPKSIQRPYVADDESQNIRNNQKSKFDKKISYDTSNLDINQSHKQFCQNERLDDSQLEYSPSAPTNQRMYRRSNVTPSTSATPISRYESKRFNSCNYSNANKLDMSNDRVNDKRDPRLYETQTKSKANHSSEEVWNLMMEMFHSKNSSTLDITECCNLNDYINKWKSTFRRLDIDQSGYIELEELIQAFQQMGYKFTSNFVQNLLAKYDSGSGKLTMDQFILICVRIQRLTNGFRSRDHAMQGTIVLQYEDFIGLALDVHQ